MDALRLLPVLGVLLWLVPLVWTKASAPQPVSVVGASVYIFAVWIALVGLGAALARQSPGEDSDKDTPPADP